VIVPAVDASTTMVAALGADCSGEAGCDLLQPRATISGSKANGKRDLGFIFYFSFKVWVFITSLFEQGQT